MHKHSLFYKPTLLFSTFLIAGLIVFVVKPDILVQQALSPSNLPYVSSLPVNLSEPYKHFVLSPPAPHDSTLSQSSSYFYPHNTLSSNNTLPSLDYESADLLPSPSPALNTAPISSPTQDIFDIDYSVFTDYDPTTLEALTFHLTKPLDPNAQIYINLSNHWTQCSTIDSAFDLTASLQSPVCTFDSPTLIKDITIFEVIIT